jgi:L-alanine-DL-glutamate epimerase-like enolase superfamily enzyme
VSRVRVAELTAFHVRIPLRRTVRHASHARTATDNIVVRCVLANGAEGWGEGVPRDYVTGETAESALDLLRRSSLSDQLTPCADFAESVGLAERLELAPIPDDDRRIRGNAARCAVELAILDAFGRHFGKPLTTVTGLIVPELHQPQPRVRYSGAITSSHGLRLKLIAWGYRLYGFQQVKVKVGIDGQDDPARLRAIRRRVGQNVELRVDANEAWTPAEAADRIRELEPFCIAGVEQPIPHAQVANLAKVKKQITTPIVLDESLCSMIDAEQALAGGWCDRFNLRLSKCGGFIPTLRLAAFARRNGLSCQLGCQVGETAILSAAGRHFASSVADLTAIEGSFDRHLVYVRLSREDITFGRGGWAPALIGPGLGVTIDPAAVERVMVTKEKLIG